MIVTGDMKGACNAYKVDGECIYRLHQGAYLFIGTGKDALKFIKEYEQLLKRLKYLLCVSSSSGLNMH